MTKCIGIAKDDNSEDGESGQDGEAGVEALLDTGVEAVTIGEEAEEAGVEALMDTGVDAATPEKKPSKDDDSDQ